jgi:phage terminase large subunit-like protein
VAQAAVLIGVRIAPGADAVDADAVRRDLLAKDKSTERIDGIVATIMAVGRALVAQEEPQPLYQVFFV